jgi:hypothetical protein
MLDDQGAPKNVKNVISTCTTGLASKPVDIDTKLVYRTILYLNLYSQFSAAISN